MSKKELEKISKKFDKIRDKTLLELMPWEEMYGKGNHPIDIVRQFIMDKGLKIYGGLALNELLKKLEIQYMIKMNFQTMMFFHQMLGNTLKNYPRFYISV